jgi:phosphoserine phosphatase
MSTQHLETDGLVLRGLTPPLKLQDFKLIAFDMDSTLINIECIDEVADAAGRKAEVAAITEATMRGEIKDFQESLRRRLALLKGVPVQHLQAVYTERLRLNPGAAELVSACKGAGLKVLLVSGGFTFFADRVKRRLNIDFAKSNQLDIADGLLTGQLVEQAWGSICDGAEKARTVKEVASLLGIGLHQCVAVGDGANDLPMMQACAQAGGLSVAYHAKPAVRSQCMVSIESGGLDQLLRVFA